MQESGTAKTSEAWERGTYTLRLTNVCSGGNCEFDFTRDGTWQASVPDNGWRSWSLQNADYQLFSETWDNGDQEWRHLQRQCGDGPGSLATQQWFVQQHHHVRLLVTSFRLWLFPGELRCSGRWCRDVDKEQIEGLRSRIALAIAGAGVAILAVAMAWTAGFEASRGQFLVTALGLAVQVSTVVAWAMFPQIKRLLVAGVGIFEIFLGLSSALIPVGNIAPVPGSSGFVPMAPPVALVSLTLVGLLMVVAATIHGGYRSSTA
jgi:hypothetical protein